MGEREALGPAEAGNAAVYGCKRFGFSRPVVRDCIETEFTDVGVRGAGSKDGKGSVCGLLFLGPLAMRKSYLN